METISRMFAQVVFGLLMIAVLDATSHDVNVTKLRETLLQKYDPAVRANFGGQPVDVGITIYVLSFPDIDDEDCVLSLSMYFRQFWKDPRLAFSENQWKVAALKGESFHIWTPDTFFTEEIDGKLHDITTFNSLIRIQADGTVLSSRRYTFDISCPMDFTYFPMDVQVCSLDIESYGYTANDIKYSWARGSESLGVSPDAGNPKFRFIRHELTTKEIFLSSGNYSRLIAKFTFARNAGYYIFHFYIPAFIITAFAYLTVWLSSKATFARLILSVSALFITTFIVISGRLVTPTVSYLTPLDIYLGLSHVMVLTIVIYHAFVTSSLQEEFTKSVELGKNISSPFCQKLVRIGFGVSILVFNFLYWIIFTQSM